MPDHLFFYLGLAFILMHEMDAIRCHEWRIFPGLHLLKDQSGLWVFMLLHIPLFAIIFLKLIDINTQESWIYGLNIFFLIHAVLHLLFLLHPKNEFKDLLSWLIILGAALMGGLDLILG